MHHNYYFLRQLSLQLRNQLNGFTLVSCFSQNKDELVMEFNNARTSFFIKASLQPQFCCLSFPAEFHRARKNSIDLFPELILKKVVGIRQFNNERSFQILLEDDLGILFKMHGNRSNVLCTQGNKVQSIFRNHLTSDLEIAVDALDRSINWNEPLNYAIAKSKFFTWGKLVWEYLEKEKKIEELPDLEQQRVIEETREQLEAPSFYIIELSGTIHLSLLPIGQVLSTLEQPIEAVNDFFLRHISSESFQTEKGNLIRMANEKIAASESYLKKSQAKLDEIQKDHHYQEWADLIMANLHEIKQGTEMITLTSFYTGLPVKIKLKKELNAKKNAEVFYRKSKNQQIEIAQLEKSIQQKEKELTQWRSTLQQVMDATDLKSIRLLNQSTHIQHKKKNDSILPYHEFEHSGFKIWVGRNAEANDELTLKYSYKEDLWLHAKDVAGSHVLIKHQAGKKIPKEVIERAAQLAAYNSKRKTDSLCPVSVTPKKFVRKRKGDPAGMVVVEKEDVILVEPRLD